MNSQLEYSPRTDVDWNQIKQDTLRYCCGFIGADVKVTEAQILSINKPIWTVLSSIDFDINCFFCKKAHQIIQNKELVQDYIMWVCLPFVRPLSEYYVDIMNGYLDFSSEDKNIAKDATWHPEDYIEILEFLWYCRRNEDIWWLLGQGIGSIKDLYAWYMGTVQAPKVSDGQFPPCYLKKDEKKALRMILFLECNFAYNKAVATTTRTLYNNAEAKKCIWQMLLPELTEDAWIYLAEEYDLSATQIYHVVLKFIETMDGLPTGWGMDLFSKMNILGEFCYTECHSKI